MKKKRSKAQEHLGRTTEWCKKSLTKQKVMHFLEWWKVMDAILHHFTISDYLEKNLSLSVMSNIGIKF